MSKGAGGGQSWVVGKVAFCGESAGVHPMPSLGPPWHTLLTLSVLLWLIAGVPGTPVPGAGGVTPALAGGGPCGKQFRACPGREGSVRPLTSASPGGRRNTQNGGSAPPDPTGAHLRRWPAGAASAIRHAAVRHGRPPESRPMCRTPCRGGIRRLARSHPRRVHHLQLAELLDPPLAVLAAEPAPLDAAEGDLGAHAHVLVDPGRAALEALGDLLAARDVGPHRAAEAVVRAVRLRERVVEVAVGDD